MIYHITSRSEWENALDQGVYSVPSLESQGFIHCSTRYQVATVANLFYSGRTDLVILCVDENRLSAELQWEPPDMVGHEEKDQPHAKELFPHVYGTLNLDAVVEVVDFPPDANGVFVLPSAIHQQY